MILQKWQFWAIVILFIIDCVSVFVPVAALILLMCLFVRSLRLFIVDFLLNLEEDKFATLNEQYGDKE